MRSKAEIRYKNWLRIMPPWRLRGGPISCNCLCRCNLVATNPASLVHRICPQLGCWNWKRPSDSVSNTTHLWHNPSRLCRPRTMKLDLTRAALTFGCDTVQGRLKQAREVTEGYQEMHALESADLLSQLQEAQVPFPLPLPCSLRSPPPLAYPLDLPKGGLSESSCPNRRQQKLCQPNLS